MALTAAEQLRSGRVTDADGREIIGGQPTVFKNRTDASITAATPVAIWTPVAGRSFRLMRGQLSLSVAGQIILKDGATELLRSPKLAAAGVWDFNVGGGVLSAAANNVLNVDVSSTGTVGGWVGGSEE